MTALATREAQVSLQLFLDDRTLGGINLYSTDTSTFEVGFEDVAELFATHAAIALGRARREQDLNIALQTRKLDRAGHRDGHGALRS